eukprot:COSAG01_NODE_72798_length_252_cov_0.627451_1_plen_48_part_01
MFEQTASSFNLLGRLPYGPNNDTHARRNKMKEHILDWCNDVYAVAKGD